MFCSKCGEKNEDTAKFCAKCGSILEAAKVPEAPVPKYEPIPSGPSTVNYSPLPQAPDKKKSNKAVWILIICILAVAALAAGAYFAVQSGMFGHKYKSAEDAANAFAEKFMAGDVKGAVGYYLDFNEDVYTSILNSDTTTKEEYIDVLNNYYSYWYSGAKLKSTEITDTERADSDDLEEINDLMFSNSKYAAQAATSFEIKVNYTVSGKEDYDWLDILCIKIDGNWYAFMW